MSVVLVVEDIQDYCEEIGFGLARDGHEVKLATSGREAVEIGSLVRPDVLVTDWMLRDHIHGLDVAEALKLVCPSVQTILISGYVSSDLRNEATQAAVFDFLEKPFPLKEIRLAVERASKKRTWWSHASLVGFLETDRRGKILFANATAEEMMGRTIPGMFVKGIDELFSAEEQKSLKATSERWVSLTPIEQDGVRWLVRSREVGKLGKKTYIILYEKDISLRHNPTVCRLLGIPEPRVLPLKGHFLIVDDSELARRLIVDVLRELKCVCHTAETHEEAIRLFAHDSEIEQVVLDFEMGNSDPQEFVAKVLGLRPQVKIIGTSAGDHKEQFKAIGVNKFLPKPWQMDDLLEIMATEEVP